jgi:hypothetical protein
MLIFRESVHHYQDDRLVVNARKTFSENHGHISPYSRRYIKRLHQSYRMQIIGLILLARNASLNEIPYHLLCNWDIEFKMESVQGFGYPFIVGPVS